MESRVKQLVILPKEKKAEEEKKHVKVEEVKVEENNKKIFLKSAIHNKIMRSK